MVVRRAVPYGGLMMNRVKFFAATMASSAIILMAPFGAHAMASDCGACFRNCTDAYANDTAPGADTRYSHCLNSCRNSDGTLCQGDIG